MKGSDIRNLWIQYFKDKQQHLHLKSASLIPDNPSLLLTNAGMLPFVPYFLGTATPPKNRIVTVQKCVRVGGKDSDLENIGKTPRHLTFFEMLGNFSFGDYFKEEVIQWAWDLLINGYKFNPDRLSVSIFAGDERAPEDKEAFKIWRDKVGIAENKIRKLGKADNFWGPAGGISGPCGPCTEIYFHPEQGEEIEIWNLVFTEYEQLKDGSLKKLKKPNVDTGLGLERLACVLQNKNNVFETDLLEPIMKKVKSLADKNSSETTLKIISDHIRCSAMLLADGVRPANTGRDYILRMLIRRAARYGRLAGIKDIFLYKLLDPVKEILAQEYPELNNSQIAEEIGKEEELFNKTLERGLKKFEDYIKDNSLSGESAFDLYATYGFPLELTLDLAEEKNIKINIDDYEKAKEEHSKISAKDNKFAVAFKSVQDYERFKETCFISLTPDPLKGEILFLTSNELILDKTSFYAEGGGQASDIGFIKSLDKSIIFEVKEVKKIGKVFVHIGEFLTEKQFEVNQEVNCFLNIERRKETEKHHTAVHLLQAQLRSILGEHIKQAGFQVNYNKARFDFNSDKPLTQEQINLIEKIINDEIKRDLKVICKNCSFEEAKKQGALAFFGDKYDENNVRIVKIQDEEDRIISLELCGGTHVKSLNELFAFKIISESSIASGIRRIELVVGQALFEELNKKILTEQDKVEKLEIEIKNKNKELSLLEGKLASLYAENLLSKAEKLNINNQEVLFFAEESEFKNLKIIFDSLTIKAQNKKYLGFLYNKTDKLAFAVGSNHENIDANQKLKIISEILGGKGGGNKSFAQGGNGDISKIKEAIEKMMK